MICRHFIAPSRAYTPFSHEIIRHPRLTSDAVRLLTWQLSLPQGARENLSRTAERAGIGATAFTRAKRQLIAEGFVHERRVQAAGGLWTTQQLVSNTPLSPDRAAKVLGGSPVPPGGDPDRVSPQVAPSPRNRAVGAAAVDAPAGPSTDGHPEEHLGEKTSHLPPHPETAPAPRTETAPETDPETAPATTPTPEQLEEAGALVGVLPLLSPALRRIPPGMRDELTRLAARWLDAGHTSADVHAHVLRGLPGADTPVHRPGGLVRYLLRDVPPRALPPRPVVPAAPAGPPLSARLAGARECAGDRHTQPMLFRPVADETLCAECTEEPIPCTSSVTDADSTGVEGDRRAESGRQRAPGEASHGLSSRGNTP
ncbi:hypothetical protein [Streptomyces sp. NPDC002057]|uniref:hypothetical protein n=1 Tax=Streptomyces sp. NPDC002057 TaxID=3154664 RepID=UPI00332121BB